MFADRICIFNLLYICRKWKFRRMIWRYGEMICIYRNVNRQIKRESVASPICENRNIASTAKIWHNSTKIYACGSKMWIMSESWRSAVWQQVIARYVACEFRIVLYVWQNCVFLSNLLVANFSSDFMVFWTRIINTTTLVSTGMAVGENMWYCFRIFVFIFNCFFPHLGFKVELFEF